MCVTCNIWLQQSSALRASFALVRCWVESDCYARVSDCATIASWEDVSCRVLLNWQRQRSVFDLLILEKLLSSRRCYPQRRIVSRNWNLRLWKQEAQRFRSERERYDFDSDFLNRHEPSLTQCIDLFHISNIKNVLLRLLYKLWNCLFLRWQLPSKIKRTVKKYGTDKARGARSIRCSWRLDSPLNLIVVCFLFMFSEIVRICLYKFAIKNCGWLGEQRKQNATQQSVSVLLITARDCPGTARELPGDCPGTARERETARVLPGSSIIENFPPLGQLVQLQQC